MSLSLGKLKLDGKSHVMGILNVTPDSFYDGGWHFDNANSQRRIEEMIAQGTEIIDIGGESTRPGSKPVTVDEELKRVIPAIKFISEISDIPISIDTQKAEVARKAVEAGACVVNDVGGLRNTEMIQAIADMQVPVIIMHMQGTPENMQTNPQYDNTVQDIKDWLEVRIKAAKMAGIKRSNMIVDPGIGFGKNLKHNLEILGNLDKFKGMAGGVLLGASRKSFIGMMAGEDSDRLAGSLAAAMIGATAGVDLVRVHDVKETRKAIDTINALN
jgi:dihydropteroate synthase|tara:strand:- start:77 stop:892 length:816 start_codon:yes stop_codon:yes gene_type:complete